MTPSNEIDETPQNNELDELLNEVFRDGFAYALGNFYQVVASSTDKKEARKAEHHIKAYRGDVVDEAKAKLEALITARQIEARILELQSFSSEHLTDAGHKYLTNRYQELNGKEKV